MENSTNAFDLLESALDQAFSEPPPREALQSESAFVQEENTTASDSQPSAPPASEAPSGPASGESAPQEDGWKAEYEAQVQNWRAQSAEAREKAEKERLRWEAIRAIEREEAAKRKAAGIVDEPVAPISESIVETTEHWESVEEVSTTEATADSSSTAFEHVEKEVVEQSISISANATPSAVLPRTDSHLETATNESQKWEDVPSVTSSFPSMSFPDHNGTPLRQTQPAPQPAPVSLTLAIFDSSLSTRTRVTAFFSALAVNLFLPFVNGVMLGFGEIFAKNVVMQWFGWKPSGPASTVTNVGIRSTREERQKQFR
ncbi:hypothetical protein BDN70DRAFT_156305 [Pholiota conissans]|uniref:Uncharacterized protein n=1 Tax=Pholiota conissans TaxID=109636 RepID=A0A9P5YZF8_9AGAR|nr:hypothetical protein BDN70DRAFT_156305 [Pholiota conissans]